MSGPLMRLGGVEAQPPSSVQTVIARVSLMVSGMVVKVQVSKPVISALTTGAIFVRVVAHRLRAESPP